jgi:hypothetical protein
MPNLFLRFIWGCEYFALLRGIIANLLELEARAQNRWVAIGARNSYRIWYHHCRYTVERYICEDTHSKVG